jgi:phosphoribosylcarboxyaminoimidazole (NCAIR) mutase
MRHVAAAGGSLACELFNAFGIGVIDHALVAAAHQTPHDIAAHAAQSDHSELHCYSFGKFPTKGAI